MTFRRSIAGRSAVSSMAILINRNLPHNIIEVSMRNTCWHQPAAPHSLQGWNVAWE